jgi:hypothetical protein
MVRCCELKRLRSEGTRPALGNRATYRCRACRYTVLLTKGQDTARRRRHLEDNRAFNIPRSRNDSRNCPGCTATVQGRGLPLDSI